MEWKSPTPLQTEGVETEPPWPPWLDHQLYAVTNMQMRLGHQLADQRRRKLKARWAQIVLSAELKPLPSSHLLRDMGRSPGGTPFPWYLVKGLVALRDFVNIKI